MSNFNIVIWLMLLVNLAGCVTGHEDYKKYLNLNIGENINNQSLSKSEKAGQLIRSDYLVGGEGLTKVTTLNNGKLRYHFSRQEILSTYSIKDYVGKCLIYYDVDPETKVILSWGYDEGGNPLSCRTWL